VNTAGVAGGSTVYMYGSSMSMLSADDPATTGDDQALFDDMLIGQNDPVDLCLWVDGLAPGNYEVLIYALTPVDPTRMCRVRVDDAIQQPTMVGGAWPGGQQEGVTYARLTVTTTGTIGFHSGLPSGFLQSGMNGFQIRQISTTGASPVTPSSTKLALSAMPNPAAGAQRIALSGLLGEAGWITIHDLAGREVWSGKAEGIGEGRVCMWSGTDRAGNRVPAGVYFARWLDAEGQLRATGRLVRVR
jgi:hypothetical protein